MGRKQRIRHRKQRTLDLGELWFERRRLESPPKLTTPQEFCLASEEFPPLDLEEALHPRKNAIIAFHKVRQLLKTPETGPDKFWSLKAIIYSAKVRNRGAATRIPEGQKQSITLKCEVYDKLAEFLEKYQAYPTDYPGRNIFWIGLFDITLNNYPKFLDKCCSLNNNK